jgi:predicted RNA-binding Zn-ribbon protein involved in translation (DUF1610 family)
MTDEQFTCPNCGTEYPLASSVAPCPTCGKKVHRVTHQATSKSYPDMEARGIPPGRGRSKFFTRVQSGYEWFRKAGRWHKRERVIDRRGNRYREYIEDAETGEVIRDKEQRLDEHVAERDLRKQSRPN